MSVAFAFCREIHSGLHFLGFTGPAGTTARPRPAVTVKTASAKTLDIDAEGEINGVGTFDYDIDSLKQEEMPWRKPGRLSLIITER